MIANLATDIKLDASKATILPVHLGIHLQTMTETRTIVIVLAAAVDTRLEQEIQQSDDPEISKLRGLPKALCPLGEDGRSILAHWYQIIQQNRDISQMFIVSSAAKYKYFERWATSKGVRTECIINNGVTRSQNRIGSARRLTTRIE